MRLKLRRLKVGRSFYLEPRVKLCRLPLALEDSIAHCISFGVPFLRPSCILFYAPERAATQLGACEVRALSLRVQAFKFKTVDAKLLCIP
jgi:hypothetical protein